MTKEVKCADVSIGGNNPVSIQSMTNTDPHDPEACIRQVNRLRDAGCDIARLTVPDEEAAICFGKVKNETDIPLVADIHFDYKMAIRAMEEGADKIRINPGNIGGRENTEKVVREARKRNIPIRIGVNSGSLEKRILDEYGGVNAESLVASAINNINMIESMGFDDIVVSIKSSDVVMNTQAYRIMAKKTDHPIHIGVTESGTLQNGIIKSSVGLGALLMDGIGDTMRVSLTGDPVNEISVAKKILAAAGRYEEPMQLVSCPTCGRTKVDLDRIAGEVEERLGIIAAKRVKDGKRPFTVAVMGCAVNGPGEAGSADFGVACGDGKGLLFIKGEPVETVSEDEIVKSLCEIATNI